MCEEGKRLSGPLSREAQGFPALRPGRKITKGETRMDRPENVERSVFKSDDPEKKLPPGSNHQHSQGAKALGRQAAKSAEAWPPPMTGPPALRALSQSSQNTGKKKHTNNFSISVAPSSKQLAAAKNAISSQSPYT